jgi:mannose-6-phosphate isomerase-like protein (cupin superfamily)
MTDAADALWELLRLMRASFAAGAYHGSAIAAEAARVVAELPDRPVVLAKPLVASAHPVAAEVPEAARLAGRAWDAALSPLAAVLPWRYGYAPRLDAPGLERRMAWAELVGPDAPIRSDRVGFGLTFIGRDTFYLPHRHPAVELYAVVAGSADWTLGEETTRRRPEDFVLHPANAVHAMRAGSEPILAIYSWTGDIVTATAFT